MKNKLKEFMDTVFADAEARAPRNRRLQELKEEMLRNLYDRYDDLVADGKSPAAAYSIAVAGVGDVTDLLDSVIGEIPAEEGTAEPPRKPSLTPEEQALARDYKHRSAIITAVAIPMYILCWFPLVVLSTLLGDDIGSVLGLGIMFLMIAGATAMLIYNEKSKPAFLTSDDDDDGDDDDVDDDDDDDDDDDGKGRKGRRPARSPAYKVISALLWLVTLGVYLSVSFATGAWNVTWLLFLIVAALDNVIKAVFDLRR